MRRVLGSIAAVACAAAGGFAIVVVDPSPTAPGPSLEVVLPVTIGTAACPGGQKVPVGSVGGGGELASEPTQRAYMAFPSRAEDLNGGAALDSDLGSQVEFIGDGDIAGLSAITCMAASANQWLVGGSTSLGASSRLVLSNPSPAPTEVTITLYGPLGKVEDTITVAVAAHSQEDRLIEADAPQLSALVVHVEASGPGVVAAIQDSRLDGFQPAGTEWVGPSDLASELVIPAAHAGVAGGTSVVRLMAPEGASVELTLIGAQGVEQWSIGRALTLEPGVVEELSLPAEALAAVEVSADSPVLAAARTVVTSAATEGIQGDVKSDDSWIAGVALRDGVRTAVTPVDNASVIVYSPIDTVITFTDDKGAVVVSTEVTARTAKQLFLPVAAGTRVQADAQTAWAIVVNSGLGQLAGLSPAIIPTGDLRADVARAPYPAAP